ncbi:uncharacterized protein LOC110869725 [Helianthus annuus]|nr:uncharacterized protein LOC110869725 [Helianthus annuus]
MQSSRRYINDLNLEPLNENDEFHSNPNFVRGQLEAQENKDLSKKPKFNKGQSNNGLISKSELQHGLMLILMRCINCYLYVMVRHDNPKCPNCHKSDCLLDVLPKGQLKPQDNTDLSKKHKLNKIEMFSMEGIKNNHHVITKPSLKSVYMPGSNRKKETDKQGDSSSPSQHELNHVLTPKSELEHEPEFVLMRCIRCIFYVMVREGNPKCPNCHKSDALLDVLPRDLLKPQENKDSSKKRNPNKLEMVSLKGIDKNCHVINEPSLRSVYMAGSDRKKEADCDSSSLSQHEWNHDPTSKSELGNGPELILMICINCYLYVMVHDGNPKCPNCRKSLMGSVRI